MGSCVVVFGYDIDRVYVHDLAEIRPIIRKIFVCCETPNKENLWEIDNIWKLCGFL